MTALGCLGRNNHVAPTTTTVKAVLHLGPILRVRNRGLSTFSGTHAVARTGGAVAGTVGSSVTSHFKRGVGLSIVRSRGLRTTRRFQGRILAAFPGVNRIGVFPLSLDISYRVNPKDLTLAYSGMRPRV